jgi:4-aminobutyrate aminotransferase / (S)-3-amino-2-methylpropionate transaminase / 5-aminovalerate transaminase
MTAGGFIVPADGFLRRVADFCRDRGILLVADEVQTGITRTGAWFACEHEGLILDLITTAKGLAGGMPLAAVTGPADVMDVAHPAGIGGTYSGNRSRAPPPLGCSTKSRPISCWRGHRPSVRSLFAS